MDILGEYRCVLNEASILQFSDLKSLSNIKALHNAFYYQARENHSDFPSQMVIRAELECLASYKSIKSNKHKISSPFVKRSLSLRLDKRIYSHVKDDQTQIKITTKEGKKKFKIKLYPKLEQLINKYDFVDRTLKIRQCWTSLIL